ncbi:MAG: nucleoside-diphosphate kinase [Anaerolineaceae bacterium]|nr:nucleoside-diphosphate kinase [Anaerolineaceae bacterium]
MERTLVLIKPDAVQRGLIGEITKRLENRGLKLIGLKLVYPDGELAAKHYAIHKSKFFYKGLLRYITGGPVVAMIWESPDAILAVRQTMGATSPTEAAPGTIRHDFAIIRDRNLTHASDSVENAEKEIAIWFNENEIIDWKMAQEPWLLYRNS